MTLIQPRALWVLIGLLAAILALEWAWPAPAPAPIAPRPARHATPARPSGAPTRDTEGWGESVLARPLFSISRRPPKIASGDSRAAAPTEARLAGIMITPYGRRAIFAPETGKQLVLAEGAAINDSTIREILPDRVILANGRPMRVTFDHRNGALGTTAPFPTGFQNPGFPNPNFPNPGFPNGNFGNPNFANPGFIAPNPAFGLPGQPGGQTEDGQPPPVPFRNPMIQPRRE